MCRSGRERIREGYDWGQHRGMEQPHGQQAAEALHYQVIQSGYGRDNRTSTQDRCVAMQTISTMTNGRTGDDADRRGSGGRANGRTLPRPSRRPVQGPCADRSKAGRRDSPESRWRHALGNRHQAGSRTGEHQSRAERGWRSGCVMSISTLMARRLICPAHRILRTVW